MNPISKLFFFNLYCFCLLSPIATLWATTPTPISHYDTKQGLSFGNVQHIVQDKFGFIWIATEDGLNRFDGNTFKVYRFDPENPRSLPSNFIQNIFPDAGGTLWVSSRKGLYYFNFKTDSFVPFKGIINDVSFITQDHLGNIWVASSQIGAYKIDKTNQAITHISSKNTSPKIDESSYCIKTDSRQLIWLGTIRSGLTVLQQQKDKFYAKTITGINLLKNCRINAITEDRFHNIWVASSKGLFHYNRSQNSVSQINVGTFKNSVFLAICSIDTQTLLLGMQDKGIFSIPLKPQYVVNEPVIPQNYSNELNSISVTAIFQDVEKNVWIGTYGEGIYKYSKTNKRFINYNPTTNTPQGKIPIKYYGITADNEGFMWLGTDGNGIYKTALNGNVVKHFSTANTALTDNAVISGYYDSAGNLWFGTYRGGLYRFNKNNEYFEKFDSLIKGKHSLFSNDIRVIYEDTKHNIWVGTNGGGLSVFNLQSGYFENFSPHSKNFPSNDVRTIVQETENTLIIGTYGNGIFRFFIDKKHFEPLLNNETKYGIDLSKSVIFNVHIDSRKVLWVGTQEQGLISNNLVNGEIKRFNQKNGLASNTILAIKSYSNECLWLSTNSGISKIDFKTEKVFNFDTNDGLQEGRFNEGSAFFHPTQKFLCFGGTKGYNLFYPAHMAQLEYQPKLIITSLDVYSGKNTDNNLFIPIANAKEDIPTVTLNANQSVFSIQYRAIDFQFPAENKFAYKLDGMDDDWIYVDKQTSAIYQYLQAGTYIFKVKVANKDNIWFDNGTALKLIILPPWYKRWWAYFIYLSMIGAAFYYYIEYRNRQAELQYQVKIAKIEAQKEKEINEKKIEFFTYISHEFRNPLTLIINPLKDIVKKQPQPNSGLDTAYRNAKRLLSLVNQLLLFRKAEVGLDNLNLHTLNVTEVVNEAYLCFVNQAKVKNIKYNFEVNDEEPLYILGDKDKLEIAVFNLISNAIKYTPDGGKISLSILANDAQISIYVSDTGTGISPSAADQIFKVFYQDRSTKGSNGFGIGLFLTKTFIKQHGGDVSFESSENGTTFCVKLPQNLEKIEATENAIDPKSVLLEELAEEVIPEGIRTGTHAYGSKLQTERNTMVIIDDDIQIRNYLKQIFENQFVFFEAESGEKGLELVIEQLPDIVLCDVYMHGLNGIEVCSLLKQNPQTTHIPLVILTASHASELKINGIEIGVEDVLSKPFDKDYLMVRVQAILKNRNTLQRYFLNEITLQKNTYKISAEHKEFIENCIKIVEKHIDENEFSIAFLASELSMSTSSLYNKIKAVSGLTPIIFVRYIRLKKAAELLITTDLTISQVSYEVGFKDGKYFREQFVKLFQVTPSQYAKKYKGGFA